MRVLIAPDKFKGSLSAMEVCESIAVGLEENSKSIEIEMHPMADGGDGSLEVIGRHLNLEKQLIETTDPLGRSIKTFYYKASNTAFIELASASGLVLLQPAELNPLKTSTLGTGKMISDALSKGCTEIYLFLGGSATNDGGMGLVSALGVEFYDSKKTQLKACGESLARVGSILVRPTFNIEKVHFTLLCDVNNPLLGTNGAAHVYARQKGADDSIIQILENGMAHFSNQLKKYSGKEVVTISGSGAAGGIAASMISFFKTTIKSGIDSFTQLTKLESKIQNSDVVISGEGRLDSQSLQGKVIDGVAQLCRKHQKPLILFVGKNELSEKEKEKLWAKQIYSVMEHASNLDDAMKNAEKYLKQMSCQFNIK